MTPWTAVRGIGLNPRVLGSNPSRLTSNRRSEWALGGLSGGSKRGRLTATETATTVALGGAEPTPSTQSTAQRTKPLPGFSRGDRIAVVGDAAHAMLPFGGMGASGARRRRNDDGGPRRVRARCAESVSRLRTSAREARPHGSVECLLEGFAMLKARRIPLEVRTLVGVCPDPFPHSTYGTLQERALDRFLRKPP
jgi:hypothetical protein